LISSSGSLFFSPGPKNQKPLKQRLDCPAGYSQPYEPPTSVHRLRPGDIRVVGAMGDSLTAANGAFSTLIIDVKRNYRGVSWSGGANGHYLTTFTLPNVLKHFSHHLVGGSTGSGGPETPQSQFNVAKAGALHMAMPRQAHALVNRMRRDPRIDFQNDWKMVTLMIGGNNLCSHVCMRKNFWPHSPHGHATFIKEALDILHANMPRTFINLVPVVDVSVLMDVKGKNLPCQIADNVLCPCLFGKKRLGKRAMRHMVTGYQNAVIQLVESGRYDTREDFTVVIQPFNVESKLPMVGSQFGMRADPTFMSADCFHLSQRGHSLMAQALWNNMLEPVGHKSWDWRIMGGLRCPTDSNPFFTTRMNPDGRR
ncbi:phospholipase B1, membrane-associated-like, partial [Amphibalanus amphitrite]|uniref:phospholipase B1, membrane-associated-like n=1 Tax=Amphibalanus amphitrite TaxID=1232801 RepID=UPI001C905A6A